MSIQLHDIKIKEINRETEDCVSLTFDIPKNIKSEFNFSAGQYLTLENKINGENVRRAYSLCSTPNEGIHKVAIKKIKDGVFSSFANDNLKTGDLLRVMKPMGNFTLITDISNHKNYIFYAAGSGITPILSMVKSVLLSEPNSSVTLFYGNKGFSSIIFREELESLKNKYLEKFRIIHVFSKENIGNTIQQGRIDREKNDAFLQTFLKNENIDGVYLCGPESMIKDVSESYSNHGVNKDKIHFELFTSSSSKKISSNIKSKQKSFDSLVTIEIDGDSFDLEMKSDGENILDSAQKNGADLPFACKGGVCCTCKAKVLKGKVSMEVNYALDADEVEEGYVLTCQSHPQTKEVLISFDD